MPRESIFLPPDLLQPHPGLGILRLAALYAEAGGDGGSPIDEETLDVMFERMERGVLALVPASEMWRELARGLMARSPSRMIRALRESGALAVVLPELSGLFGMPQISDGPGEVDLGIHLMNTLNEAARCGAPLAVRFALLVMNAGKTDSPREHLPVHYRHIERGRPRIEAICARFGLPERFLGLALMALVECERVHRVSEIRAGPVAAMLERLHAFDDPELFGLLMNVCACDYRAYGDRSGREYPKEVLLRDALRACEPVRDAAFAAGSASGPDALREARAAAIAIAFRSLRWSA